MDSFKKLCYDETQASMALIYYRERYSELGLYENEVYPGTEQLLKQLVDADFNLYLATSKPYVYAVRILKAYKLHSFFKQIYGSELNGTRADKTDLLEWIILKEELNIQNTWMIGDRKYDSIGAQNNGIKSIGVLYGYGSKAELEEANVDQLCLNVAELQTVLLSLN